MSLPLFLTLFIILVLGARLLWFSYLSHTWKQVCAAYVSEMFYKGASAEDLTSHLNFGSKAAQVWPLHLMVFSFWVWDFKKFIVNQDEMNAVLSHYLAQRAQ